MRSRPILVVLILVTLGLVGGFFYLQTNQKTGDQATDSAQMTGEGTESGIEMSPVAEPDGSDSTIQETNMNPDLTVDANGLSKATAVIVTDHGAIRIKFYSEDAPKTVSRIVELINQGFYNGLTFHRVVPNFVVQGGDPEGTGTGGSGQNLKAEFNRRKHVEGTVAMARASDPNSADSQFYIALSPQPHLDGNYTVFGQVVEGMDVVRKLQQGDKMQKVYVE